MIGLKGNRLRLHDIVKDLPFDQIPVAAESAEKKKGRTETRTTKVVDAPRI